ncbi:MAG: hypothetical protein U9Q07_15790 [Planctomycetota bacterium]|nr:hypothetical protein [Planctomycetota bacterium]
MRSQMKDVIVMLILVATPTTWSGVTATASPIIKVTTGSSVRTLVKPNGKKPGKPDSRTACFSPPPKGHGFTKIPPGARYKRGELLVSFALRADGTLPSTAERKQIIRRLGGGILKRNYRLLPALSLVALPPSLIVKKALVIYNRSREIAYAEPNYEIRIPPTCPEPAPKRTRPGNKPSVLRPQSPRLRLRHSSPTRKTPPLSAFRRR